jgi:tetratricopeptide (TPR) repeat protein
VPTPLLVPPAAFAPPVLPGNPAAASLRPPPRPAPGAKAAARAAELIRLGDRHFRAGDFPRAVKRYEGAIAAHPELGLPRSRLAQVELARGRYREAVDRLREATAAEPGWLAFADDIQGLYPEPRAYAAMIARLEAHLQQHPFDRDAWTLLGSQWLLSGRRKLAADAFLRLTDQPADALLVSLLTASGARK